MGVLPLAPGDATDAATLLRRGARADLGELERLLRDGFFTLRVNTVVSEGHIYVTYVKSTPAWVPHVQDVFRTMLARAQAGSLPATHAVARDDGSCDDAYREKVSLRLFSVPQLRRMVARQGGGDRLRAAFQRRLSVILDQFPDDGLAVSAPCVHGPVPALLSLETYQKLPLDHGSRTDDDDDDGDGDGGRGGPGHEHPGPAAPPPGAGLLPAPAGGAGSPHP